MENFKIYFNKKTKSASWFLPFNGLASAEPMTSALRQKSAFSLAEAMIMLVVVSIILGASAPLIAKKFMANSNRAVIMNNAGNISKL